jgi:type IV pilus assembly protein PilA
MVPSVPDTCAMGSFLSTAAKPATLLAIAAFVVGCGDGGRSTTVVIEQPQGSQTSLVAAFTAQRARGQDAEAKSDARNMVSQVESCAADYSGEYEHCEDVRNTGLAIGSGPGQVEVQTARITYTVTAHSRSGNTFQIIKNASGIASRACKVDDDPGGCLGGTW